MIKKSMARFMVVLIAIWIVGGCAKKLMPPEVEGQDSSAAGAGASSGIGEGGVGGSGGGAEGSSGILQEGTVGEKGGGTASAGSSAGKPGGDTEGFGAGAGAGAGSGAGAGAGAGSGAGAGAGAGSGAGSGAGAGAGAGSGAGQEARSLQFEPTSDLGDVFFAFDKYDLDDNSRKILQKNADWLKQHPGVKTQIEGHCDERGTNNYNLALGERRALATKKYLSALGVEDSRLYTISYGEEKPFCMEHNEGCWKQNRRGHFLVSK